MQPLGNGLGCGSRSVWLLSVLLRLHTALRCLCQVHTSSCRAAVPQKQLTVKRAHCLWFSFFKSYIITQWPSCDTRLQPATWSLAEAMGPPSFLHWREPLEAEHPGHHDPGIEGAHWEVSATAQLTPDMLFCVFCFIFCRVNILKISFKRKKFFIHQRQKQVSSVYARSVSCFQPFQLLVLEQGEALCHMYKQGGKSMALWWREKGGGQSPEVLRFSV